MEEKRDGDDGRPGQSTWPCTRDIVRENERLRALVETHAGIESGLRARIAEAGLANQALTQRYLEVEQLNSTLVNLYVASYRIHGSLERGEVLSTLQEILINVIGTEEFAVFEREGEGVTLRCAASFGVDAARIQSTCLNEGEIGAAISRGTPYVAVDGAGVTVSGHPITACIPLRIGDRVSGAIIVYRLLSHKPALEPSDVELFNLLATHGATALYCSALHARREREARA